MRNSVINTFIGVCLIGLGISLTSSKTDESVIDNSVVRKLDIRKYTGSWYEIARYDHFFERGLVGVTANYSIKDDGTLKVVNSGYKNSLNGKFSQSAGKAYIPDPVNEPAKIKVSFFLFFYADYFVMELDKDYQWAVIGSNSDKYLWILCRTPQMKDELYNELLEKLKKRGYDVSTLIKVLQKEN